MLPSPGGNEQAGPSTSWQQLLLVLAQADLLVNIAPKKPNWDLRRDVAKQLEKLERRTQRAIVQLLQQEQRAALEGGGGQAD